MEIEEGGNDVTRSDVTARPEHQHRVAGACFLGDLCGVACIVWSGSGRPCPTEQILSSEPNVTRGIKHCIAPEPISEEDRHLLESATLNDREGVLEAIKKGADPNACKEDCVTSVHIASEKGFYDVVEAIILIAKEKNLPLNLDSETVFGNTPLVLATHHDRIKILELLLQSGADPNKSHTFQRTPIHVAAYMGRVNAALKLIQYKADVNAVDCFDHTPLSLALLASHSVTLVKHLLRAGANPNFRSKSSVPLLCLAVLGTTRSNELKNITFLIRSGADVDATDMVKKDTALHKAAITGYIPAINLLMRKGADLFAENAYGETPLNVAIRFQNNQAAVHLSKIEDEIEEEEFMILMEEYERKYILNQ